MLNAWSRVATLAACSLMSFSSFAAETADELARAFGARPSVSNLRLSPDGSMVAYEVPLAGQGGMAMTYRFSDGRLLPAVKAGTAPATLGGCNWISNTRLACRIDSTFEQSDYGLLSTSRLAAVDADGSNVQMLSLQQKTTAQAMVLGGGYIVDSLPDEDGVVLMARHYVDERALGSRLGQSAEGLAVDRVDTRTGESEHVERPSVKAADFYSDGKGRIRIKGLNEVSGDQSTGVVNYIYRTLDSDEWKPFGNYNFDTEVGFMPVAIDADTDSVYGYRKLDGRQALYRKTLGEHPEEQLVYAHDDVDVAGLIRVGETDRVVGVTYVTDSSYAVYFDKTLDAIVKALHKSLPEQPMVSLVDISRDGNTLLVHAGSDDDPGVYYVFHRDTSQLETFLVVRDQLEGRPLANVQSITYPAADGVSIPAYLTLPPGMTEAKGLPAIVLPHGGPDSRDQWGFDWLPQYYAARGYAVLQPNFRGSAGYGDAWFQENGFKSWRVAIGDVSAAGHWLLDQGIADPGKLAIVGWSFGGYAALQSAAVEPELFKAVVAIAPVTDLAKLKEQYRGWSNFKLTADFIGSGANAREGSPSEQAKNIHAPVLLFHGDHDRNVDIRQSNIMESRLKSADREVELVTFPGLDHQLEDSEARATLLSRSDAFMQNAFAKTVASSSMP